MNDTAEFDRFADTYDADLNQALSVSGETKDYVCVSQEPSLAPPWITAAGLAIPQRSCMKILN
jgi:hypothetical protein